LPYVSSKGKKLLYLVNRKILKEQIENEFKDMLYEERHSIKDKIKIETYQAIELEICKMKRNGEEESASMHVLDKYKDYDYIVCDECHYFLADSNFNTNTIFSFRFVQEQFTNENKIRIFMSATINDIKSVIIKDNERRIKWNIPRGSTENCILTAEMQKYESTYHYGIIYNNQEKIMYRNAISNIMKAGNTQYEYTLKRDYSYININILADREQIADIIKEEGGKWFIFVDSIEFGNELKKKLEKETRYTVVMIKAEYRDDEKAIEVVDEIVEKGTIGKADIIISTSVMDNGINLKDEKLNHFVLLADTEVEFIQMLGRKRRDDRLLELYIIGQDRNHFEKRKRWVEKRLQIAEEYLDCLSELEEQVERSLFDENAESYCWRKWTNLEEEVKEDKEWVEKYSENNYNAILAFLEEKRNKKKEQEQKLIEEQHIKIMGRIFDKKINYDYAKNIYNVYKGKLYLNLLSFQNLENLNLYYKGIIEKFDSVGEDAFLKEQLGWLGKQGDEADKFIERAKKTEEERAREAVIGAITKLIEDSEQNEQNKEFKQPLEKKAAIEFKKSIKDELIILLKNGKIPEDNDRKKCLDSIKKNDRPISEDVMEYLRKNCNLPFMVKEEKGKYTFTRCAGDSN